MKKKSTLICFEGVDKEKLCKQVNEFGIDKEESYIMTITHVNAGWWVVWVLYK